MFTWPGESRLGIVSLRLSCAVKPFAAQAATPSEPLPSGRNWVAEVLASPMTTFERETIPPMFCEKAPFCQAVVVVAAAAGVPEPRAIASGGASESAVAAAASRSSLGRADTGPPSMRHSVVLMRHNSGHIAGCCSAAIRVPSMPRRCRYARVESWDVYLRGDFDGRRMDRKARSRQEFGDPSRWEHRWVDTRRS